MKKNIAIFILSIISIISIVFAFAQATIAKHAEKEALSQREIADTQSRIAQLNADSAAVANERARIAEIMASQTMVKLQEAKDALAKCK